MEHAEPIPVVQDVNVRQRHGMPLSYMVLSALPMMLAGGMDLPMSKRGLHRGEYGKPRNTDNRPDRAKGMKPFDIDGVTIYAGTMKAARKKARLLKLNKP